MSSKQNIVRIDAKSVQGAGAFVEFRKFTWHEIKALNKEIAENQAREKTATDKGEEYDATAVQLEMTERLILERLENWNWVDNEGHDLPKPPTVEDLDKLNSDEVEFLTSAIEQLLQRKEDRSKN